MPLDVITADFSGIGQQAGITDWSISQQWASRGPDERYSTLRDMLAMMDMRAEMSEEQNYLLSSIIPRLTDDGAVGFEADDRLLTATNYSFHQIASEMKMPVGLLRGKLYDAPELVVNILDHGRRKLDDPKKEVQLFRSGVNLRGVTGPKYGRIEDREIVRAVEEAIGESGAQWRVPTAFALPGAAQFECIDPTKDQTTLYASDRDVCIFLVDELNPIQAGFVTDPRTGGMVPDLYSRGIIIRNGECGGVGLSVSTFLYRWVCFNRSIREQKGFQKVSLAHRANVRDHFLKTMLPAMKAFVNGSAAGIADEIQRSKDAQLVRDDEDCMRLLTHTFNFADDVAKTIMGHALVEDQRPIRTCFDAIQAMTAAARSVPHQDDRMQIERAAGKIYEKLGA